MPWGSSDVTFNISRPVSTDSEAMADDDVFQDEEEGNYGNEDMVLEWSNRQSRFRTHGYRDGITAGKNSSVQEGFNRGFLEGAAASFRWGQARGIASALAALPFEGAGGKLVPSMATRERLVTLEKEIRAIPSQIAASMFYQDYILAQENCRANQVEDIPAKQAEIQPDGQQENVVANYPAGRAENQTERQPEYRDVNQGTGSTSKQAKDLAVENAEEAGSLEAAPSSEVVVADRREGSVERGGAGKAGFYSKNVSVGSNPQRGTPESSAVTAGEPQIEATASPRGQEQGVEEIADGKGQVRTTDAGLPGGLSLCCGGSAREGEGKCGAEAGGGMCWEGRSGGGESGTCDCSVAMGEDPSKTKHPNDPAVTLTSGVSLGVRLEEMVRQLETELPGIRIMSLNKQSQGIV